MNRNTWLIISISINVVLGYLLVARSSPKTDDTPTRAVAALNQKAPEVRTSKLRFPAQSEDINQANNAKIINRPMALLSGVLMDPKTAPVALDFLRGMMRRHNQALFNALKLPPEKLSSLQDLMAKNAAARLTLKSDDPSKNVGAQIAAIDQQFNPQYEQLLGSAGAALAEDTLAHPDSWEQVSILEGSLQTVGAPALTEQQLPAALATLGALPKPDPGTTDEATFNNYVQNREEEAAAMVTKLSSTLDPKQLEVVSSQLNDNITQMKAGFLMSQLYRSIKK